MKTKTSPPSLTADELKNIERLSNLHRRLKSGGISADEYDEYENLCVCLEDILPVN